MNSFCQQPVTNVKWPKLTVEQLPNDGAIAVHIARIRRQIPIHDLGREPIKRAVRVHILDDPRPPLQLGIDRPFNGILKVGQLGRVRVDEQNAVRVDVAVDDPLLVQVDEGVAHVADDFEDAAQWEALQALVHNVVEGAEADRLEDEGLTLQVRRLRDADQLNDAREAYASQNVLLLDEEVDVGAIDSVLLVVQALDGHFDFVFPNHALKDEANSIQNCIIVTQVPRYSGWALIRIGFPTKLGRFSRLKYALRSSLSITFFPLSITIFYIYV